MTNKKYLDRIMPHEEHYCDAYWDTIRGLQEVFGRTSRPNTKDQPIYEACRQRLGAEKMIRLASGHRQQVLDKIGGGSPWSYFRGILQRHFLHPSRAGESGCPSCGEQAIGLAHPETWVRRKSVRLSYECPTCKAVSDSEWCYPADKGQKPTERWAKYELQRGMEKKKSLRWREALGLK